MRDTLTKMRDERATIFTSNRTMNSAVNHEEGSQFICTPEALQRMPLNFLSAAAHKELNRLYGMVGNLYVLKNTSLKDDYLYISTSRRSGWAMAMDMNRDKRITIPGEFECVFEMRAQDSGRAIESVYKSLAPLRCGKTRAKQQHEFFAVSLEMAIQIITHHIKQTDQALQKMSREDVSLNHHLEAMQHAERAAPPANAAMPISAPIANEPLRASIFKRAWDWLS